MISSTVSDRQYLILAFIEPIVWAIFYYWMCDDLMGSTQRPSFYAPPPHKLFFWSKMRAVLLVIIFIYFVNIPYDEIFNRYVVSVAKIASPSMEPTLNKGGWVFVKKILKPVSQLKRSDVVVFKLPGRGEEMAKRILGLPGDRLTFLKEGIILVNGEHYPRKWEVSNWAESFEEKELIVPSGHVFLMGDNPQYSFDSFQFGSVPIKLVVGRVLKVFYPLTK